MADEHYRWLDRDAAERLLRGEPLEAIDAGTRDEAERLADALDALVPEICLKNDELPGEEAALAAFRAARAEAEAEPSRRPARRPVARTASDAGLVQLGRPAAGRRRTRWGSPVRYGLVAALAGCMIGGVAVAASTGVLPFTHREPNPAASVAAAATPESEQPLVSPTPSPPGPSRPAAPDGSGSRSADPGTRDNEASGDKSAAPGREDAGRGESRRSGLVSSCRALRDGRALDPSRRRELDGAAQGSGQVKKYCKGVLDTAGGRPGKGNGRPSGQAGEQGDGQGSDKGGDKDGDKGGDDRGGDPVGNGPGRGGGPEPGPRHGGGRHGTIVNAPVLSAPAPPKANPRVSALPVRPASP